MRNRGREGGCICKGKVGWKVKGSVGGREGVVDEEGGKGDK